MSGITAIGEQSRKTFFFSYLSNFCHILELLFSFKGLPDYPSLLLEVYL